MDLKTESYFGLNDTGTRVWQLMEEGASFARIVETMVQEFDAPAGEVEADSRALVEELVEAGLVSVVSAAGPDD